MSIDELKLDYPIQRESVPQDPMSFGFVARPVRADGLEQSGFALIAVYFCIGVLIVALMQFLAMAFKPAVIVIASQQRIFISMFAIALILRVIGNRIAMFSILLVIATITGVVQAAVFATNRNATNGIYLGYLMLLSLWPVAELAIHYSAIDRQLPRFSKAKGREKQENSMTALLLITAIGTMALCLCFSFDRGKFGIYMLVCVYAYLAATRTKTQNPTNSIKDLEYRPMDFLKGST